MKLPCRHILALHEIQGVPLLSMDDIPERWTMAYFNCAFNRKEQTESIIMDTAFSVSVSCSIVL